VLQRAYGETRNEGMGPFVFFWILRKRIVFVREIGVVNIRWFSVRKHLINIQAVYLWSKKRCWLLHSKENFRQFPADVIFVVCAHPSLFAVSQMLGVAPRVSIYITRSLQLLGASELFDNSNRYSSHTAWLSRNLNRTQTKKRMSFPSQGFCKEKTLKILKIFWGRGRSVINGFSLFS